jgi:hypothetical protein
VTLLSLLTLHAAGLRDPALHTDFFLSVAVAPHELAGSRRKRTAANGGEPPKLRPFRAVSDKLSDIRPNMAPKMRTETATLPPESPIDATTKQKARLLTLDSLDRRTAAYRETRQLIDDIEADLGGRDALSAASRQLVQHAAVLGAMLIDSEARYVSGEPVDPMSLCTLINAQRRVLETVGLQRRARDVTDPLEYARRHAEISR